MKIVRTKISADKLAAFLTILSEPDQFPTANEVTDLLNKEGIVFGIDKTLIESITDKKEPVTSVLIAQGEKPRGRFKWHISLDNPNRPTITSTDRADFKQLISYNYVEKGQEILTLMEPSFTRTGITVEGQKTEESAGYNKLPDVENIKISEDGNTLIADENGYLIWEDERLTISTIFHVKGDVDYSTGNLKVKGPVKIDGDVRSGFRVETDSSIYVGGTVDAANLYAQHGDITIIHGILGQNRAKILCGGSLKCAFAQDANIAVNQDVDIDQYAINCIISAGGTVRTNIDRSFIRGGSITAEKGIYTSTVGSQRSTYTELKIRNYKEGDSQSQLWKLSRERANLKIRLSSLQKRGDFLNILKNGIEELSYAKKEEVLYIKNETERLLQKLNALDHEEDILQKATLSETFNKEIHITNTLYRNVLIDISGSEYYSDHELSSVGFMKINDEIIVSPIQKAESETV
ncbi:MAG: DUF342 domain-containing protein [Calditrichae bacterium]|nr:DUF342 domain-containing protein [Calditrichota bacterium]MCB9059229.1 DUF342 domain-containing protein [Calditrichia bacterium]